MVSAAVDASAATAVVAQLKEWLRAGEAEATDLARREAPLLQALLGEQRAGEVLRRIATFEQAQALALLEESVPGGAE